MLGILEKVGSIGTFITAAACPVCWPLFASIGATLGLGILAPYEGVLMTIVFPAFILISVVGTILSFINHRTYLPLLVSLLSAALVLYGFYGGWHLTLMYIGIFGLLAGSVLGFFANKKCKVPTP